MAGTLPAWWGSFREISRDRPDPFNAVQRRFHEKSPQLSDHPQAMICRFETRRLPGRACSIPGMGSFILGFAPAARHETCASNAFSFGFPDKSNIAKMSPFSSISKLNN